MKLAIFILHTRNKGPSYFIQVFVFKVCFIFIIYLLLINSFFPLGMTIQKMISGLLEDLRYSQKVPKI